MTDKEIIKALECCVKEEYHCNDCPYESDKHFNKKTITFDTMPNGMSYDQLSCDEWLKKDALDLINRQQAEIERLERILGTRCKNCPRDRNIEVNTRTEAIKEFAERLTHTLVINNEENDVYFDFAYTLETIDTLVKEMTEGQK